MIQPLLTTRLVIPPLRPKLVSRTRLLQQLDEGLQPTSKIILITAPAGYGKTTLLVEWVNSLLRKRKAAAQPPATGVPAVSWLSLGDTDNDLATFLAYLLQAVKDILSKETLGTCQSILATIGTARTVDPQGFLIALLNGLSQLPHLVILILDDYHAIQDPTIHQAVQFLLKNLPANLHLVIATRSDPPLGLAQLRARDQLCEMRMADLVFTEKEAAEFLNRWMELDLSPEDITALLERTEGWAAGLQLAAIAIQSPAFAGNEERAGFIRDFRGSHRHILEYLAEEVFSQQPEAIQTFLLCTSVLERLSGPLCDALLQRNGGGHSGKDAWVTFSLPPALSGQDYLERLEHDNLFLLPLDAEHCWFRYHPLFAELLKSKLKHDHPGFAEILLERAARWSEKQGQVAEAFAQALASTNFAFAADLFERHILTFFYQSEITQVQRWLSGLPEDLLRSHPLLGVVYAAAVALQPPYPPQSLAAAEEWMQAAEHILSQTPGENDLARAFALNIRSYWARFRDEPADQTIHLIQQALAVLPAETSHPAGRSYLCIRSALQTNLALTHLDMGDEPAAQEMLLEARRISSACGDLFNESASINSLVRISCLHGQLEEAAGLCREALEHFAALQRDLGRPAPFSGEIGVQLGEILVEQNKLAEAEPLLKKNIELARWTMSHNILLKGQLALSRVKQAQGDLSAALVYLAEVEKLSRLGAGLAGSQRAGLWLASSGENPQYLDQARKWAPGYALVELQSGQPHMEWNISLVLAHLVAAEKDRTGLFNLLEWTDRQVETMRARGWAHWEIQLLLVKCLTWQALGEMQGALAALRSALELAEPGGYIRLFVEEGEPLQKLLRLLGNSVGKAPPYVQMILAAFPTPPNRQIGASASFESPDEPLTTRELEVLRLICQGLSNQEIAGRLVVTLNTVKKHNYSIFQKLGVPNRAQAILAARKMGLFKLI